MVKYCCAKISAAIISAEEKIKIISVTQTNLSDIIRSWKNIICNKYRPIQLDKLNCHEVIFIDYTLHIARALADFCPLLKGAISEFGKSPSLI